MEASIPLTHFHRQTVVELFVEKVMKVYFRCRINPIDNKQMA